MQKVEVYMTADNDEGVLVKVCNLFAARGYSIETIHAEPLNEEKTISSIAIKANLPQEKLENIKEKLMQIVPIRDVKIAILE
ncbi:ACT domain-containing protein [Candidatus Deianiraea vastatrix]|uniref:Acetolactate synthase 3 regulatory subunit domain protein n=1 Tax=Candidatus Deianiraea vastatrix TaxID=2163644 RepID=A0A5B8XIH8_9RICK|nr:ACT domain-containing protein [Candidatus Deianiraea vastatrix]QED23791.1 Putative acetolactate synthase 3 regulatory subunit domain protein [Candidatus Deianiraea vastatrix]